MYFHNTHAFSFPIYLLFSISELVICLYRPNCSWEKIMCDAEALSQWDCWHLWRELRWVSGTVGISDRNCAESVWLFSFLAEITLSQWDYCLLGQELRWVSGIGGISGGNCAESGGLVASLARIALSQWDGCHLWREFHWVNVIGGISGGNCDEFRELLTSYPPNTWLILKW